MDGGTQVKHRSKRKRTTIDKKDNDHHFSGRTMKGNLLISFKERNINWEYHANILHKFSEWKGKGVECKAAKFIFWKIMFQCIHISFLQKQWRNENLKQLEGFKFSYYSPDLPQSNYSQSSKLKSDFSGERFNADDGAKIAVIEQLWRQIFRLSFQRHKLFLLNDVKSVS